MTGCQPSRRCREYSSNIALALTSPFRKSELYRAGILSPRPPVIPSCSIRAGGGGRCIADATWSWRDALKELAHRALDTARLGGAQYADARVQQTRHQEISVKRGQVDGLIQDSSEGIGVRVLVDGAWGFACTYNLHGAELDRIVGEALGLARASARVHRRPVGLGPPVPNRGSYRGPAGVDPFSVSIGDKVSLLVAAEEHLRSQPQIRVAEASTECTHWSKLFLSTEGAEIEQEAFETGAGIECSAVDDDEVQKRSYPNSFGREVGQGGRELVGGMGLGGQ